MHVSILQGGAELVSFLQCAQTACWQYMQRHQQLQLLLCLVVSQLAINGCQYALRVQQRINHKDK